MAMPGVAMPDVAMVFAAGFGTRMRPITDTLPKPLIPVAGKALIDHVLEPLRAGRAEARDRQRPLPRRADRGAPGQTDAHPAATRRSPCRTSARCCSTRAAASGRCCRRSGDAPFFLCNTDAFWLEGGRSNLAALVARWDPAADGRPAAGRRRRHQRRRRLARATSRWTPTGGCAGARRAPPCPSSTPASASSSRPCSPGWRTARHASPPPFSAAAERGRLHGQRLEGQWLHVGTPGAIAEAEATIARSPYRDASPARVTPSTAPPLDGAGARLRRLAASPRPARGRRSPAPPWWPG